MKVLAHQRLRL